MNLWLLDADIIIDFLSIGVFDKLVSLHEIHVSSTIIDEVKYYKKSDKKHKINFREQYIDKDIIKERSASLEELDEVLKKIPPTWRETIDPGELESLAILKKEENLVFCCCDAAAIRALPFLDVAERGISAEELLKKAGLQKTKLKDRHKEEYFKTNLEIGKKEMIYNFKPESS